MAATEPVSDAVGERFGAAVRALREARGWSQERLALIAQLNRGYMSEVERATAMPSLQTAAKLAEALQVPLSTLIRRCEGDGEQLPGGDGVSGRSCRFCRL